MKALVFSDSHGYLENMKKAIDYFDNIKTIFYLGDFIDDSKKINKIYPDLKIYAVSGNNDFTDDPDEITINTGGHTIFMTHGHKYGVYYSVDKVYYKGLENNANIIFFGHSHKKFFQKTKNGLILNPGSISYPRDGNTPTFAIIEYENAEINASFFGIEKDKIIKIF